MMGRSVMTLAGAITAYTEFAPQHYNEETDYFEDDLPCEAYCDHSEEFKDLLTWIEERAIELWPSFTGTDRWIGRELHVIAENAHSVIAVAEYGDLVSINLGANYDRDSYWADDSDIAGLGAHWRAQVESKFLAEFGEYTKLGTMSNGEGVFQKVVS